MAVKINRVESHNKVAFQWNFNLRVQVQIEHEQSRAGTLTPHDEKWRGFV